VFSNALLQSPKSYRIEFFFADGLSAPKLKYDMPILQYSNSSKLPLLYFNVPPTGGENSSINKQTYLIGVWNRILSSATTNPCVLYGVPSDAIVSLRRLLPSSSDDTRRLAKTRAWHVNDTSARHTSGRTSDVEPERRDACTGPLRQKPRATYGGRTHESRDSRDAIVRRRWVSFRPALRAVTSRHAILERPTTSVPSYIRCTRSQV